MSKGTYRVVYNNEKKFDSHSCSPPNKLSKFIIKRNVICLYSEYKTEGLTSKTDSHCAGYSSKINYLTKNIGIDFESAVLNIY